HWDPREQRQYERMKGATCKSRLCDPDQDPIRSYRMPNCAAFVRPTDRLQEPSSRTVSSGLHVPVCVVDASWIQNQNKGKSIRRGQIENRSLSHKTFGELFDNYMVGSK